MRVVIVHAEMGIYLGNFLGLGLFSLLDSGDQPAAVTFPDEQTAREYIKRWESSNNPDQYRYVPVNANEYAYYDSLAQAGLAREAAPLKGAEYDPGHS